MDFLAAFQPRFCRLLFSYFSDGLVFAASPFAPLSNPDFDFALSTLVEVFGSSTSNLTFFLQILPTRPFRTRKLLLTPILRLTPSLKSLAAFQPLF